MNCLSQSFPVFKPLRYDEDYSSLKKDSSLGWYQRTKFQSLSKTKNAYISYGGDIRYQYFWFKNEDWGETPEDKDGFILTRYLAHADFHAGKYFRTFVQLQSSLANGRVKTPSPVEENQLDLHQAFFDVLLLSKDQNELTLRVGRQELSYGSQRLVAVREGPNNRQSFDAVKIGYTTSGLKVDGFFSHYVISRPQVFDDGFNKDSRFWGAYMVKNNLPVLQNIDFYYFGLWKRLAKFDDGPGRELRHSFGSRIWSSKNNFKYDIEGVYQFGSLDDKRISAWTFSVNTSYKFSKAILKPEIGLKTELISGDASYGDNKLQTFNPLFPKGSYFGLAALIGPANLLDVHPSMTFELTEKLSLDMDCDLFWRYSKNDGIYGPNVALIYSGKNNDHTHIGDQLSTDISYTPNKFLYFRWEFTWFSAGDFLKTAGPGKDILFAGITTQFKF